MEEWTRPVMALATSNWTFSKLPVVVADNQGAQAAAAYSGKHDRVVDLTTVRSETFQDRASHCTEDVDAARHRLTELPHMLSKGELPVVSHTH